MNYYDKHAKEFIQNTINCNMEDIYNVFLKYVSTGKLLDVGFGSGRDMFYFKNKGFDVYGIDTSKKLCEEAKLKGLKKVYNVSVKNMNFENEFDCVWACSSLLHIESKNLNETLKKCEIALKNNGIMYCSFKYGDFEGYREDRYYTDLTETSFSDLLKNTNLTVEQIFLSNDVRTDNHTIWLNVILKKQDGN